MRKPLGRFFSWMATHEAKYSLMLVLFMLVFFLQPLFGRGGPGALIFEFFFSLLIISSIHVSGGQKRHFYLLLFAGVISLAAQWSGDLLAYNVLKVVSYCSALAVLFMAMFSILQDIIRAPSVLYDTIAGAICVYLLIGLFGGVLFTMLEFSSAGSFSFPERMGIGGMTPLDYRLSDFIYYSYTTLTTVGFGDITPVKPMARSLSMMLAIIGQIYLTVVMGVLIGVFLSERSRLRRTRGASSLRDSERIMRQEIARRRRE